MPENTVNTPVNQPPESISPKIRSRVYIGCLIVDVLAILGFGLSIVFGWLEADVAAQAGGIIVAGISTLAAGLGVAYRPTRPGIRS